ncbi:MAG: tRNA preQ1(34) S-adenosylmethionine ribosyltransferase-isomerase QueA [Xenococcaceae cyanobacterium MO_188.B32]|nr:tRNA preQ1(34) S-adenosylmethionine ribosyltransferase-isomerase QueA [Xenococcaceae cyanobacterium MO_188.B32]
MNKTTGISDDRLLSSYSYELPEELIAQTPIVPRDNSRLLVVDSPKNHVHSIFHSLIDWLSPGDLLILNNTRVIPARLYGYKSTGTKIEILLLEEKENNCWLALVKPGRRLPIGAEILFEPQKNWQKNQARLKARVIERDEATGGRILQFTLPTDYSFQEILADYGQIPLPPYISSPQSQPHQYQTVYAQQPGAVAAPTAGLHFTSQLLDKLSARGIQQAYITLHVGVGTFRPVETEKITDHAMHQEWVEVSSPVVEQITETKARGGRVIAVGTTAVRAIEGAATVSGVREGKVLQSFRGKTNLFIYPGYDWQIVDGLITNFHLPYSSLLMLVSALIGRERLLNLYREAIAHKYRFYSFGDAMLILPEAKSLNI